VIIRQVGCLPSPGPGDGGFAVASSRAQAAGNRVRQSENTVDVSAELPGLTKDEIEITIDKDLLTIRGEKRFEHEEKKKDLRYVERSYGSFLRSIAMPFEIDQEKVEATLKDGVMRIHLLRRAEAGKAPRKIAIK
jgi:HSP20 family protein